VARHDLESPGGDTPAHWSKLYRSRGDGEVVPYPPTYTGDVFQGTTVISPDGAEQTIDSITVQHPCACEATALT
jgi:hypothetical protein